MITITKDNLIPALKRAVALKGADYRITNGVCQYVNQDGPELQPDCLIGHALVDLGVPMEKFLGDAVIGEVETWINACKISTLLPSGVLNVKVEDPKVITAMSAAQRLQDDGGSWGEALKAARLVLA